MYLVGQEFKTAVKLVLSGHPQDLPKYPPTRGCQNLIKFMTIAQCLLTIHIQRFLCTVTKFQVVSEAIQSSSSSSSSFITNFNLFVIMPFKYSNDNTGTFNRLF